MGELLVAAAVLGVLYLVTKRTDPTTGPLPTVPPPVRVPNVPRIGGQVVLPGSYGVPPLTALINSSGTSSPGKPPSTINYPGILPPPPPVSGGLAGVAGTLGLPLGSQLMPGVSTGTGTSVPTLIVGRVRVN